MPAWICGWAPTIGGLVVSVRGDLNPPRALLQLYYMAFLIGQCIPVCPRVRLLTIVVGFFISAVVFYALNVCFPLENMDQIDSVDVYGTFTEAEARRVGVAPLEEVHQDGLPVERHSGDKDATLQGAKEV